MLLLMEMLIELCTFFWEKVLCSLVYPLCNILTCPNGNETEERDGNSGQMKDYL